MQQKVHLWNFFFFLNIKEVLMECQLSNYSSVTAGSFATELNGVASQDKR